MTLFEKNSDFCNSNKFIQVDQPKQKMLVNMLIETTEQIMKKQGGLVYELTYTVV